MPMRVWLPRGTTVKVDSFPPPAAAHSALALELCAARSDWNRFEPGTQA